MEQRVALYSEKDSAAGTIDVLFIEPDVSGKVVTAAWLCKNMYFDSFDGTESRRTFSETYPVSYEVNFKCLTERGAWVLALAEDFLKKVLVPEVTFTE
jgi:hypothetical protein